jgi:very-short-patch-repair endonuclease
VKTLQPLIDLAGRQHGLLHTGQLSEHGCTNWERRQLSSRGIFVELGNRVVRLAGATETPEQRIMLGVLGTGANAVASHGSAAYLWGALHSIPYGPIDVLTRRDERSYRSRTDCRVHRPVDWLDVGTARRTNIPVTHPVRTLIDLGATCPPLVKFAVERMIIAGHVTPAGLRRSLAKHARQGRGGVTALRTVLDEWSFGEGVPDSVLEMRFADVLARRRLPSATFHHHVQGFILDAAWPDRLVAAEVDGWSKYTAREQFQKQIERDALLESIGWRLFHFTWHDVTQRETYVANVLRRALRLS